MTMLVLGVTSAWLIARHHWNNISIHDPRRAFVSEILETLHPKRLWFLRFKREDGMIDAATLQQADGPCDWSEQSEVQAISLTAVAAGFFFSFRAILVMISARWLNLGTEPGVIASLAIEFILLLTIVFQGIGPGARLDSLDCPAGERSLGAGLSRFFLLQPAVERDRIAVGIVSLLVRNGCGCRHRRVAASHRRSRASCEFPDARIHREHVRPRRDRVDDADVQSDLRLGDPDYFNTNQIGNLCAMAIFMAQFLHSRKDGKWKPEILFLTVTLLRSLSKATIIAFVLARNLSAGLRQVNQQKKESRNPSRRRCPHPRVLGPDRILFRFLHHHRQPGRNPHRPHRDLGLHSRCVARQAMDRQRHRRHVEGVSAIRERAV